MKVQYRPLLEKDVTAIARVHRRACLIAYAFMGWSHSETQVRDWYAEKFPTWDWGLVAEQDGSVVGFIAALGTFIDQLFVDPGHQRRGIGTALLRTALVQMHGSASLTVFEENASARRFYEKHDFREVRRFLNERERAVALVYGREGTQPDRATPAT